MNDKIQAYMEKRIDCLLEAIADASLEISEKQGQGIHSTFHILNKALSQDRKFREEFKLEGMINMNETSEESRLAGKSIFELEIEKQRELALKHIKDKANKKEMYSFTVTIDGNNMGLKLPEYPIKLNMDKEKRIEYLQRYIDRCKPVLENGDKNFGLEICKRALEKLLRGDDNDK